METAEAVDTKECRTCHVEKPLTQFYKNAGLKDGRLNHCVPCQRAKDKAWRETNAERIAAYRKEWNQQDVGKVSRTRAASLRVRYGITQQDYGDMLQRQHGGCAICKTTDPGRGRENFCVDHNHETGEVRGLLCKNCNTGLGMFGDSIASLIAAADYLNNDGGGE